MPDVAETWDVYRATYRAITGRDVQTALTGAGRPQSFGPKKVVWFGNYGASHSNFGIFSLKPTLKSLRAVNHEIPLELVIISNNEAVYNALVHECGFLTRYVPWSPQAVYSELASAHAALLTTGDDDFCEIKSSSRVLQAFAAGVPVITAKGTAISEFDDAIAVGRMKDALRSCLGPSRQRFVPPRLASARRILPRYTPERVGAIWASLLNLSIRLSQTQRAATRRETYLLILESGDDIKKAHALLSTVKQSHELDYILLASTELVEFSAQFRKNIAAVSQIPSFLFGTPRGNSQLACRLCSRCRGAALGIHRETRRRLCRAARHPCSHKRGSCRPLLEEFCAQESRSNDRQRHPQSWSVRRASE